MLNSLDPNKAYATSLKVDPASYKGISIQNPMLSVRSRNCLKKVHVRSLADLLFLSPAKLRRIPSLGQKSFTEIEKFIEAMVCDDPITSLEVGNNRHSSPSVYDTKLAENTNEYAIVEDVIGQEMCQALRENRAYASVLIDMFNAFLSDQEKRESRRMALLHIPEYRRERKALLYYQGFKGSALGEHSFLKPPRRNESLEDYILNTDETSHRHIFPFISFCALDVYKEAEKYFSDHSKDFYLLSERSTRTLEDLGNEYGLTRERIRQKEKKASAKVINWLNAVAPIPELISADLGHPTIMKEDDFQTALREYTAAITLSIKSADGFSGYYFDKEWSVFLFDCNLEQVQKIRTTISSLPKFFPEKDLLRILERNSSSNREKAILQYALPQFYTYRKGYYFRNKLTIGDKYGFVLHYFYPNGIHIYGDQEFQEFASLVKQYFDDADQIDNHRAVIGNVTRIGMLCDRGCYKYKGDVNISKALVSAIKKYIEKTDQPIMLVEDILSKFSVKLSREGINNKYLLQSVLQEVFAGKYRVYRAFLFKSQEAISIYDEVGKCISDSPYPLSTEDIKKRIVGINNLYIGWAIAADRKILSFFGSYFYADNLKLTDAEIEWLHGIIEKVLSDGLAHPAHVIYNICISENPFVLQRNYIQYPYSLFSLLQYLFEDEYQFSRPLIGPLGVEMEDVTTNFKRRLYECEEISIPQIRQIAEETGYLIYSYQTVFNGCIEKMLIRDRGTLISIEATGITEEIAHEVEHMIANEINSSTLIRDLLCFNSFPQISVPWTEWLVYSTLKKWSSQLEVATTNVQLKYAFPVVAPSGKMETSSIDTENISEFAAEAFEPDFDSLFAAEIESDLFQ